MLNIKNIEILKGSQINDWNIVHVFKNYTNDMGKGYYIFQLSRASSRIGVSSISLEKDATNGTIDLVTNEKRMLYELKGPGGTMNLYLSQIKDLGEFIYKMKQIC